MTSNINEHSNTIPSYRAKLLLVVLPFLVLLLTKLIILLSVQLFQSKLSWIPGFIGYYLSIVVTLLTKTLANNRNLQIHDGE
ncbi:MAG: hypothetical protein ACKODM_08195, partial [Cytophagales bacterium]